MDNPADKKILPFRPAPGTKPEIKPGAFKQQPARTGTEVEAQSKQRQVYAKLQSIRAQAARAAQEAKEAGLQPDEEEGMGFFTFYVGLVLSIIGDVIEIATGGTLGWVTGLIIDAILLLIFGFSKKKRDQMKKILIAMGIETIPIVGFLPVRTVMIVWAYLSSQKGGKNKLKAVAKIGITLGGGAPLVVGYEGVKKLGGGSSKPVAQEKKPDSMEEAA